MTNLNPSRRSSRANSPRTGSAASLTVSGQTAQTVEERAELKLTRAKVFNASSALLVDVTGGALGVQRVGSNIVNAALLGQSIPFATPGADCAPQRGSSPIAKTALAYEWADLGRLRRALAGTGYLLHTEIADPSGHDET